MRLIEWIAPDGLKHLSWLRERDPDEDVALFGLPYDPPDLTELGLPDAQHRALHNALVERRLTAWQNSTTFKNGLAEAIGVAGLNSNVAIHLLRLYTAGPIPKSAMAFDLQTALDELPYSDRQRDCIKRTFAQAGIRDLAGVENAPTRVGHICNLDIYRIVAQLLGKEV